MKLQPTFPGMLPNEKVILLLHRHWIVGLKIILLHLLLTLLPIGAYVGLKLGTQVFDDPTTLIYAIIILLITTYALFWGLFFFISWLNYYLDTWIVTNERIINIEQIRLFYRVVSEQKLYRVQDVTWEMKGAVAGIFRYGNVEIQTAGKDERFVFAQVPKPEQVAHTIMTMLESIEKQIGLDKMAKVEGEIGNTKPTDNPPLAK
jgi:hypothetical protein